MKKLNATPESYLKKIKSDAIEEAKIESDVKHEYWRTYDRAAGIERYAATLDACFPDREVLNKTEVKSISQSRYKTLKALPNNDPFIKLTEVIAFLDSYNRNADGWKKIFDIANKRLKKYEKKQLKLTPDMLDGLQQGIYPKYLLLGLFCKGGPTTIDNIVFYLEKANQVTRVPRGSELPIKTLPAFHQAYKERSLGEKESEKRRLNLQEPTTQGFKTLTEGGQVEFLPMETGKDNRSTLKSTALNSWGFLSDIDTVQASSPSQGIVRNTVAAIVMASLFLFGSFNNKASAIELNIAYVSVFGGMFNEPLPELDNFFFDFDGNLILTSTSHGDILELLSGTGTPKLA